ncbi:MAG: ribonuclease HI [Desulfovibrionaceae bacterium]
MKKHVLVYSDGSCLGNPGPGGWGAILRTADAGAERRMCGGFRLTTNNRMEITAVLEALRALKEPCIVDVYTDSRYVCDSIEKKWLFGWQKRNWIKADKKPAKNRDLWERMLPLLGTHEVRFHWLKGHAGHPENEACDCMARAEACKPGLPEDPGMRDPANR